MTERSPVNPTPGPLEEYDQSFDDLFGARAHVTDFAATLKDCCYQPNATRC